MIRACSDCVLTVDMHRRNRTLRTAVLALNYDSLCYRQSANFRARREPQSLRGWRKSYKQSERLIYFAQQLSYPQILSSIFTERDRIPIPNVPL